LDEVSIRRQVIFNEGQLKGYIDYGNFDVVKPSEKDAKNAIFVMATQVNGQQKTPLAYILTNGIDSDLMSSIVKESLKKMFQANAHVLSTTFDGLRANLSAIEKLGGNICLDDPQYRPYINHPSDPNLKVYITPDACHMVKLIRNCLEYYETFLDPDGNVSTVTHCYTYMAL